MSQHEPNRWKGFVLGAIGGAVGVVSMRYYWKAVQAITGSDPRTESHGTPDTDALDSISLIGTHHRESESSTAAVGRIAYQAIMGKEPESQETKTMLSYLVHWILSMFMGGLYGAVRGEAGVPDVPGGLVLGIGLWLFGDELAFPLLGVARGPTAVPPVLHVHALGTHVPYGVVTAATTQFLQRVT
ncbi:MAG: DUF1440 domain-containing protein [Chloroflexota bacterium]|nr:DUF1440 domain-containing protein [Chloroflexota bacterium]